MGELKTVDLYLASSIYKGVGGFSTLLVYQNKCKMVYGTYDDVGLVESLLLGLAESLKLLKEKCTVRVNALSNNVVKALMKSKSNINDNIRSSAVEQVSKHNIEFIIVKEDDTNRIILDRVKRHSKAIVSNEIRNKVFVEHVDYGYYFRPKEEPKPRSQNSIVLLDNLNYLNGLSYDTKEWVIEIINTFDLNLYHSATATINANNNKRTLDEIISGYIEKNMKKRTYIQGNEEKIKEIFYYVCDRLKTKNGI